MYVCGKSVYHVFHYISISYAWNFLLTEFFAIIVTKTGPAKTGALPLAL